MSGGAEKEDKIQVGKSLVKSSLNTKRFQSIPDGRLVYYANKIIFVLTTNIFQFNLHSMEAPKQNGCS